MATKKSKTTGSSFVGVDALKHAGDKRRNIPTAEYQSLMADEARKPVPVNYPRSTSNADHLKAEKDARNHDLDPQLVWRGKDAQDWTDLVVNAPPLYIQEKVHPKVLIDDLLRGSLKRREAAEAEAAKAAGGLGGTVDMFGDFNGIPAGADKTDFYAHDQNWTNRMILGDSLQVMASLAEREGLRGKVQCVYFDPPYGIKFNSNFQWSTTTRTVSDGNRDHISREPEQVKAFRDTWRDGLHTYLTYLRDRLTVARDLLTQSGSVFVQIGDENVGVVRDLLDEVFGASNRVATIVFQTTSGQTSQFLATPFDYVLHYARDIHSVKFRVLFAEKNLAYGGATLFPRVERPSGTREGMSQAEVESLLATGSVSGRPYRLGDLTSQRQGRAAGPGSAMHFVVQHEGRSFEPTGARGWSTTEEGMRRLLRANRLENVKNSVRLVRFLDDYPVMRISPIADTRFTLIADTVSR